MEVIKCSSRKTKRLFQWIVRGIIFLVVLLVIALIYLRTYGIPDPLLRRVVRRANDAGILVEISSIKPSLKGWRADEVRYYSSNPADTKPIFKADEVYFPRFPLLQLIKSANWEFYIEAVGVEIGPSVEWGIEVPEDSQLRMIESASLSFSFLQDRIELSEGTIHWLGAEFLIDGTLMKPTAETKAVWALKAKKEKPDVPPVYVSEAKFLSLRDKLSAIQIGGDVMIDISFHVDVNDYPASSLAIEAKAHELMIQGIDFSRAAVSASCQYPMAQLEYAVLNRIGEKVELTGGYDLSTELLEANLSNTITTKRLLETLPDNVLALLEKLGMHFGQLPKFDIGITPCNPVEALNHLSGTFSIEDFNYGGSTIQFLGGKVERQNDRLLLSELEGTMLGLENRAEEMGSAMLGGTASGSVFFDSQTYYYGVTADMNLDPSLLIGPLQIVRIATNVMHRFKFNGDDPPSGHVELGQCVTNLSTFFIDVQMTGNDVTLHDAELSSLDLSASYTNQVLVLDPLTAMLGTNELTGTALIDFRNSSAQFDVVTTIPPLTLQNAIHPQLDFFGKSLITSGETDITAKGEFGWKPLQVSDLNADIQLGHADYILSQKNNPTETSSDEELLITLEGIHLTLSETNNGLSGNFSVEDLNYAGSVVKSLSGMLEYDNDRLKISDFAGTLAGQVSLVEEMGSSMLGGPVSGSASYNLRSSWFSVNADFNMDPSLLIDPLSPVQVATNVLHRFKFNGKNPPIGHFELGSCITNWGTFFIDVQMEGDEVTVHEAEFSSVDLSASYSNQVLVLDSLTAMQGTNDLTGTATIDLEQSTARIDITTSIAPLTLQNAIFPQLGVFGTNLNTSGRTSITAKGVIDWDQMQTTDFIAEVAVEKIELPMMQLTDFSGTVAGEGPLLALKDSKFTLFEGKGDGDFSLEIGPQTEGLPFSVDLNLDQLNVQKMVQSSSTNAEIKVSGMLGGSIRLKGDLEQDFFESVQGDVSLAITDAQLAQMPSLEGFVKTVRKVIPSFNVFLFTGFSADYQLGEGVIKIDNAYLEGDVISAKGQGQYSMKDGFDAIIQIQTFSSRPISKVVRLATDPLLKLVEIKLTGTLKEPSWKLK